MACLAVVLASGSGQRFEAKGIPKHLITVLDVPVIVWTLNAIKMSDLFSEVVVVTRKQDLEETKRIIEEYIPEISLFIHFTSGSSDRTQSFNLGFKYLKTKKIVDSNSIVALFDANRPLTPKQQLIDLCNVAKDAGCSCPARPVINGVAKVKQNEIIAVPEKSNYSEFVTPEFISLKHFDENKINFLDGFNCFVEYALHKGVNPYTIPASSFNVKLTYPEDKTYLEGLALDHCLLKPDRIIKK